MGPEVNGVRRAGDVWKFSGGGNSYPDLKEDRRAVRERQWGPRLKAGAPEECLVRLGFRAQGREMAGPWESLWGLCWPRMEFILVQWEAPRGPWARQTGSH